MGPGLGDRPAGRGPSIATGAPGCALAALALVAGLVSSARAQGPDGAASVSPPSSAVTIPSRRSEAGTVGFRSFVLHDPARAWSPDPLADEPAEPRLRPIRVALWYPAARPTSAPITRSDYLRLADETRALTDWSPDEVVAFEDSLARAVRSARGLAGSAARAWVDEPMGAEWDAPVDDVRGPLVVYLPAIGESGAGSARAFEQLAARGAIVAALPSLGEASELESRDVPGLEARARDAAFVLGVLLAEHAGRIDGVALIGRGWGATAAAVVAMRRPEVEALVALGGSAALLEMFPDWDPVRMRTPLVSVGDRAGGGSLDEIAPFAARRRVTVDAAEGPPRLDDHVDVVREFLASRVGGSGPSERSALGEEQPAPTLPPDLAGLARLYAAGRADEAAAAVREARRTAPDAYREATLIQAAERVMAVDPARAVPALELTIEVHPDSPRARALLAEAREAAAVDGTAEAERAGSTEGAVETPSSPAAADSTRGGG